MLKVNWNHILTSVISTFLAAIIVGAAAIVWVGATTVDSKVTNATKTLASTVEYTKKAVDILETEIIESQKREADISEAINEMSDLLNELRNTLLYEAAATKGAFEEIDRELEGSPVYPKSKNGVDKSRLRIPSIEISKPNFIQQRLPELDVGQMESNAR